MLLFRRSEPMQTKPTRSLFRNYGMEMLVCNFYVTHVMYLPMSGVRLTAL